MRSSFEGILLNALATIYGKLNEKATGNNIILYIFIQTLLDLKFLIAYIHIKKIETKTKREKNRITTEN